MAAHSIAIWWG